MKIKEVEAQLNIPKATIRFYEKEGLLTPQRHNNSYRDYSTDDIETLKKIIVLRKIGLSIEDIKNILSYNLSLQDALVDNINNLNNQIKEIEGAIRISTLMQDREESINTFDEDYYLKAISLEEEKGNIFFDIINDVIAFEKKVIWDEFGLIDEEGNMKYSLKTSILIAITLTFSGGILWYVLDGMNSNSFIEGLFFPFVCIIITSIFGLPLFFLEKKNKKLADLIKKIGYGICIIITIVIIIMMIFLDV